MVQQSHEAHISKTNKLVVDYKASNKRLKTRVINSVSNQMRNMATSLLLSLCNDVDYGAVLSSCKGHRGCHPTSLSTNYMESNKGKTTFENSFNRIFCGLTLRVSSWTLGLLQVVYLWLLTTLTTLIVY